MTGGGRTGERIIGRYALYGEIASGGMATVCFGRLVGPAGFSRTVAIKRLHPPYARDPEFVSMFLDEARLAARVQHPNVVPTLDVVAEDGELFLVMEYVQGESLARLMKTLRSYARGLAAHQTAEVHRVPPRIAAGLIAGVLLGLHAAHEAESEQGAPLGLVHRDVSPQNILAGTDGVARVLDFGVAKAAGRLQTTRDGQLKGKLAYMAPEQLRAQAVDRRTDVYGASVVLWEALTGDRLYEADNEGALLARVLEGHAPPPSARVPGLPPALDAIVMCGLARDPAARFATARDMAIALEDSVGIASPRQIGEWVQAIAGRTLARRAEQVKEIESLSSASGAALRAAVQASAPSSARPAQPESIPAVAPHTQVSSIAVSRLSTPPRPPASRPLRIIAAAVTIAIGGAVAFGVLAGRSGAPPAADGVSAAPAAPPADTPAAATAATTPPPADTAAAAPAATAPAAPAIAPAESAGPTPAAPAAARGATGASVARPQAGGKPRPPAQRPSCEPPYTVDAQGIRRIKPECMQ